MIWKLAGLFIAIPTIELIILLFVGSYLGPLPTTVIIVVTGFTGAWLAKREGTGVLRQLSADLGKGIPPATRITEGVLVLAGGLFLLTPGILTDLAGFLFIVPWSRRQLAPILLRWVTTRLGAVDTSGGSNWRVDVGMRHSSGPPEPQEPDDSGPFEHPVA